MRSPLPCYPLRVVVVVAAAAVAVVVVVVVVVVVAVCECASMQLHIYSSGCNSFKATRQCACVRACVCLAHIHILNLCRTSLRTHARVHVHDVGHIDIPFEFIALPLLP